MDLVKVSRNVVSFYFWTTNALKFSQKNFYLHTTIISALIKKSTGGAIKQRNMAPLGTLLKTAQNTRKSADFYWSHKSLGMSYFCARHVIRKEIVHTFHFLTSKRLPRYVHTCGTQKAHRSFFQKQYQMAVPVVCLMCAYNVPGVCTYLGTIMIRSYSIRAFQRTPARLFTTKIRFCSSI